MRQFLLPAVPAVPAARPGAVLEITGSDYHYLVRVLRLRPGAVIPVADAAGRRGRATVTAIDHRSARLLIAAEGAETAPGPAPAPAPRRARLRRPSVREQQKRPRDSPTPRVRARAPAPSP